MKAHIPLWSSLKFLLPDNSDWSHIHLHHDALSHAMSAYSIYRCIIHFQASCCLVISWWSRKNTHYFKRYPDVLDHRCVVQCVVLYTKPLLPDLYLPLRSFFLWLFSANYQQHRHDVVGMYASYVVHYTCRIQSWTILVLFSIVFNGVPCHVL